MSEAHFRLRDRARNIVELHEQGMSQANIARHLGCSKANVSQTLSRHLGWSGYIAPLPQADIDWIVREAKKSGVPAYVMARAMLIDAIDEARTAEKARHVKSVQCNQTADI